MQVNHKNASERLPPINQKKGMVAANQGSTAHIMQMLNESDNALYGLQKTATLHKQGMMSQTKGGIKVTHTSAKNDRPHPPSQPNRGSFEESDEYYNDEEDEEDEGEDESNEEEKNESDRGAERIEKRRVRGQKKKFNKSKVFNRVVRGNVLE